MTYIILVHERRSRQNHGSAHTVVEIETDGAPEGDPLGTKALSIRAHSNKGWINEKKNLNEKRIDRNRSGEKTSADESGRSDMNGGVGKRVQAQPIEFVLNYDLIIIKSILGVDERNRRSCHGDQSDADAAATVAGEVTISGPSAGLLQRPQQSIQITWS